MFESLSFIVRFTKKLEKKMERTAVIFNNESYNFNAVHEAVATWLRYSTTFNY